MRVLIVDTSSKLGTVGGAQRVAANVYYELRKRGIDTYYFGYRTDYLKNDRKSLFISAGAGQKNLKQSMEGGGAMGKLIESVPVRMVYYSFYSASGIDISDYLGWLGKVDPDIVVANAVQDLVVVRKMKKHLPRAKFIYIDHANVAGDYEGSLDYNALGLTFGTGPYVGLDGARKRLLGFFDGVVALNKMQKRGIRRFNSNVTIIHSSSLLSQVRVNPGRLKGLRRSLGLTESNKVVLYLGRLAEAQKNVGVLISAFKRIKDKGFRLLVVGDGKSKGLYEQMASDDDRIKIVGRIPDEMVAYYYSLAGLYVLPSLWEGFNATFIEAANFGAPLLLSKKSINEDIVDKFGKRLYTFNPKDVGELEAKIKGCFSDQALQKRLVSLSREIAAEYSKKKQMDGYAVALRRLMEKGKLE